MQVKIKGLNNCEKQRNIWKKIESQRQYMDSLFYKSNFTTFEDWKTISKSTFLKHKGISLLSHYYSNNIKQLLRTIYPNYPFEFKIFNYHFKHFQNQQSFMDELFHKLNYKTFDDWRNLKRRQLVAHGGERLIQYYYRSNMYYLFQSIYPNFPWNSLYKRKFLKKSKGNYKDLKIQREFMDFLYKVFQFTSFDDWVHLSRHKLVINGGRMILHYYNNDYEALLIAVYPNYPFRSIFQYYNHLNYHNFYMLDRTDHTQQCIHNDGTEVDDGEDNVDNKNLKLSSYRRNAIDYLDIDPTKVKNHFYYNQKNKLHFWESLENQRKFMDDLFQFLKLKHHDDWLHISKSRIAKFGGQNLIRIYSNDLQKLLSTIYPDVKFSFDLLKQRNSWQSYRSLQFHIKQLIEYKRKFSVFEKKDWFRIDQLHRNQILRSLKFVYPNENWDYSIFHRSKKSNQRYLFSMIQSLFCQYLLYENHRPPQIFKSTKNIEFDIFLPHISLAVEYQGEQHYYDIPQAFNQSESYLIFDQIKSNLATLHSIYLLQIPFWWDRSLPSLFSTLHRTFPHLSPPHQ